MTHPCKVQLRDFSIKDVEIAKKIAKDFGAEIEGLDLYFDDVNTARIFISKLKKFSKFKVKMSTEYIGKKKILFVYSLRGEAKSR